MGSNPTSTANPQRADLQLRPQIKINKGQWSRKWSRNVVDLVGAVAFAAPELVPAAYGRPLLRCRWRRAHGRRGRDGTIYARSTKHL